MHKDWVDPNLHLEEEECLEQDQVGRYGQFRSESIQRIADYENQQLHAVKDGNRNAYSVQNGDEEIKNFPNVSMKEEPDMHLLKEGINTQDVLANVLFTEHVMQSIGVHDIYWDLDDNVC